MRQVCLLSQTSVHHLPSCVALYMYVCSLSHSSHSELESHATMAPRAESSHSIDQMDNEEDASASVSKQQQVEGVSVGFADLTYEVPLKNKKNKKKNDDDDDEEEEKQEPDDKLTILHSISGSFLPGKMIALMGPR